jgi:hypothetical protein
MAAAIATGFADGPERSEEPCEGTPRMPTPDDPKPKRPVWRFRLPASTPPASVLVTPWVRWPAGAGLQLTVFTRRWQSGGRLALHLDGCADPSDSVWTALGHLDIDGPGEMGAWLPASRCVRLRADLDPSTGGEVAIWAEPEQES